MIYCKELNKEFNSKKELIKALWANKDKIINLKKAAIHKSIDKGHISSNTLKLDAVKGIDVKEGFIYPVINTTMYFDSHYDVHLNNIWNKSLNDNNKFFYVSDHELKASNVIAWPDDVNAYVKEIEWKSIGKDFDGKTQALIFEIKRESIVNVEAAKIIDQKRPVQNSVRMRYVKIRLAVNSTDKEYKEAKALWDAYINQIANKDIAEENGYMWLVSEAKIEKEGSLVLFGSNDATPIITEEKHSHHEPLKETEPPRGTHPTNHLNIFF